MEPRPLNDVSTTRHTSIYAPIECLLNYSLNKYSLKRCSFPGTETHMYVSPMCGIRRTCVGSTTSPSRSSRSRSIKMPLRSVGICLTEVIRQDLPTPLSPFCPFQISQSGNRGIVHIYRSILLLGSVKRARYEYSTCFWPLLERHLMR